VRVREGLGAADSLLGVPLMRQAFGRDKPLADPDSDPGEVVAEMEFFAGAVASSRTRPAIVSSTMGRPPEPLRSSWSQTCCCACSIAELSSSSSPAAC
jgi:hypothetical protein